jgi:acyl-CoA synthetase (AMP-forming)/AMP-acid ligase II
MVSMGAALPAPLKRRILDEMGPVLMDLYGLTEGFGSTLKPEDIERKTGCVGTPVSGTDVRIVDDPGVIEPPQGTMKPGF